MSQTNADRRRRYAERKQAGLCPGCGRVPDASHTKCEVCRAFQQKSDAKVVARRKREWLANEKCTRCGGERDSERYLTCAKCRADSRRSWGDRYRQRRADGLCGSCGVVPSTKASCDECKARHAKPRQQRLDAGQRRRRRARQAALDAYGHECACCGEDIETFLTIDHIANDGAEHRQSVRASDLYGWLRRTGYPDGFQTLCYNCNNGKRLNNGVCPHLWAECDREELA